MDNDTHEARAEPVPDTGDALTKVLHGCEQLKIRGGMTRYAPS